MEADVFDVLERFKNANIGLSLEQEINLLAEYVYSTNKLEGNLLNLAQTKSIIEDGIVSGDKIRTKDLLEQRGTYRAIKRMLSAVANKEPLTLELIKELNWLTIGSLYRDEYYYSYKEAGQQPGEFKIKNNQIKIIFPDSRSINVEPLSNPVNVELNMKMLLKRIENSEANIITKASFLAQEIWLHQPFIDGNKRTARLLINFLTMKEGFPLFTYSNKGVYFNDMLVKQYIDKKPGIIESFIENSLLERMQKLLSNTSKKSKGYRFML